jgi:hypothetical protein
MTLASQARGALAGPGAVLSDAGQPWPLVLACTPCMARRLPGEQLGLGRPPDRRPRISVRQSAAWPAAISASTLAAARPDPRPAPVAGGPAAYPAGVGGGAAEPGSARALGNDALGDADEARLTAWMEQHLTLSVWVPDGPVDLGAVEAELLGAWQPPLNLAGVTTPWTKMISDARRVMAAQARTASRPLPPGCWSPVGYR